MGADATLRPRTESARPANDDDTLLPFSLPNICKKPNLCKKKVTAAFDGGQGNSGGMEFLLAAAGKRPGLTGALARLIPDHRDPALISHFMADILRGGIFAIACGYPMATISTICAPAPPASPAPDAAR